MSDERPDLADVMEHYDVQVNRAKNRQMVPCCFHEDRTPSCSVNLNKGVWRCHSCNEGGDSYALIMKKEEVNFVRARELAASFGFTTGSDGGGNQVLRGSAYGGRRRSDVPHGTRDNSRRGGYVPRWRR